MLQRWEIKNTTPRFRSCNHERSKSVNIIIFQNIINLANQKQKIEHETKQNKTKSITSVRPTDDSKETKMRGRQRNGSHIPVLRNSSTPCAKWHLSPKVQDPLVKFSQSLVLKLFAGAEAVVAWFLMGGPEVARTFAMSS